MATPKGLKKAAVTIYLDRAVYERLRALSSATHVPQQWYLREGLALILEQYRSKTSQP